MVCWEDRRKVPLVGLLELFGYIVKAIILIINKEIEQAKIKPP